jgi:MFS family permease
MRLIRTRLTWYGYLLSGFFTFIISIQGNIIPFLRDELQLSYAAVGLHPSALAAGMIATGFFTERVLAALGRRWTCLLGVAGCVGGLLAICVATDATSSVAGCALVGLTVECCRASSAECWLTCIAECAIRCLPNVAP